VQSKPLKRRKLDRAFWRLVGRRILPTREVSPDALWLQAVSVGEVEVAVSFAREIRSVRPALPILATSSTPAGFDLLEQRFGDPALSPAESRPFPLDLPFSVRRFFAMARPQMLVLVETELWPVVLLEAGRRGVPVVLVNARLSERSAGRFRAVGPVVRRPLAAIRHVAARTEADARRFLEIGVPADRVSVTGDLKYDRGELPEPDFAGEFRRLAAGRPVLVAGSLADQEVPLLLDLRERLRAAGHDLFVLLAPRRPESFGAVAEELRARGISFTRRTAPGLDATPEVFLLDSIGELGTSYRLGTLALLGGTFAAKGGHNVLEPLAAGLPVLHGPSVFNIAATLAACPGATFATDDAGSLARTASTLLSDGALRAKAAAAAETLFRTNRGAAARAAALTIGLLEQA
jgi:3-deoxy-D-manno-octulosonic-acid transferase